ncbi:hypothetical protein Tco_1395003 [Tanacetum coccineum]
MLAWWCSLKNFMIPIDVTVLPLIRCRVSALKFGVKNANLCEGFDTPCDGFGQYKLVLVVNNQVLLAFISTASFEYYYCQGKWSELIMLAMKRSSRWARIYDGRFFNLKVSRLCFLFVFLEERCVCVEKILESNMIWNMDA